MAQSMAQMQQLHELDVARAARAAPGARRVAARGHGPALAGRPARPQPAAGVPAAPVGAADGLPRRRPAVDGADAGPPRHARRHGRPRAPAPARPPSRASSPRSTSTGPVELLGDDAARSLERLAELAKMLEDAGLIEQREGRLELTPRGIRAIGQKALGDLFRKMMKDRAGRHEIHDAGSGHDPAYEHKPYEWGDPFRLNVEETVKNAIWRQGAGTPVRLQPGRLRGRAHREHHAAASTVLLLDVSLSMPMRDNFLPAKKVAMALHSLISTQFPRDYLGLVSFGRVAARGAGREAARDELGLRVGHQHAARAAARPQDALEADGHQAGDHGHRRRADGPHHARRLRALRVPVVADHDRGDAQGSDAVHARRHPHQHVHARRELLPPLASSSG